MIQITPGDVVAVEADGRYYYALILDRIRLFGGNWAFVFHASSDQLLTASSILEGSRQGFHAFVDFIFAKRENRLTRVARKVDTTAFRSPGRLKGTHATKEKAKVWFIYDMDGEQVSRLSTLTPVEAAYPNYSRIDDTIMIDLANRRWLPEQDHRI
jgi:hypothetical protein